MPCTPCSSDWLTYRGHKCVHKSQATSLSTLTHEQLCKLLEGTTSAQHEEILGQRLYPSVQACAHDPVCTQSRVAHATLAHLHKVHPVLGLSSVQAVDPVHAFKLIGMLLDAHMNLMTIDIVRLLYSPEMVRLYPRPAAASRPHACMLTHSLPFNTRAVPQLLKNIKEAKEVLAASLARGDAGPVAESLEQMKTSEAKTEEQEMKAEKPKPQVGRPCSPSVYGATKPLYQDCLGLGGPDDQSLGCRYPSPAPDPNPSPIPNLSAPTLAAASLELKAEKQSAHSGFVYSVAFSPDGKTIVSGSGDNTIKVWDAGASALTPSNP